MLILKITGLYANISQNLFLQLLKSHGGLMRIKLDPNSSFELSTALNESKLSSSENEQLAELFQKIHAKGQLGAGASSRLEHLIGKLENPRIKLIATDEAHSYILKVDVASQIIQTPNVNAVNKRTGNYDKTPLQLAINGFNVSDREASLQKIRGLVENPALDINYTDREGWSAAYQVTQMTDPEALALVLSHPDLRINSKNMDGSTPIIRAADRNNTPALEAILKLNNVKVDHCNDVGSALTYAARKGHTEVVKMLLQAGALPNKVSDSLGKTALMLALEGGHEETAKLLRLAGGSEETPPSELQKLVSMGAERLKIYLKDDVNRKDEYGRSAAHYWAHSPNTEVEALLKSLNANLDLEDKFKRTPLHYAAMEGHTEAIDFLLEQGVNVNHPDKLKYSPLIWTAQYDRSEAAMKLLDKGADLNQTDKFGWTALEKAAESNSANVCALLATQVDVNRQAPDGRTALHKAAINNSTACIAILRDNSGRTDITDNSGKLPIDYATKDDCRAALLRTL